MCGLIIPPYFLRRDWAEENLKSLRISCDEFCGRKPYSVTPDVQDGIEIVRPHFEGVPPVILRDVSYFCHNLRCALDYLAVALTPGLDPRTVNFPLFWKGVWNEPLPQNPKTRGTPRQNWDRITDTMNPRAVTVIEGLQPDKARRNNGTDIDGLFALYELWNEDKHRNLPVLAADLADATLTWESTSGDTVRPHLPNPDQMVQDGAPWPCPANAVKVQLNGAVHVCVGVGDPTGFLRLVPYFERLLRFVEERVIDALYPMAVGIP
jgi:hypothetical protein